MIITSPHSLGFRFDAKYQGISSSGEIIQTIVLKSITHDSYLPSKYTYEFVQVQE